MGRRPRGRRRFFFLLGLTAQEGGDRQNGNQRQNRCFHKDWLSLTKNENVDPRVAGQALKLPVCRQHLFAPGRSSINSVAGSGVKRNNHPLCSFRGIFARP